MAIVVIGKKTNYFLSHWLFGLVAWFSLRVREVLGSIPRTALVKLRKYYSERFWCQTNIFSSDIGVLISEQLGTAWMGCKILNKYEQHGRIVFLQNGKQQRRAFVMLKNCRQHSRYVIVKNCNCQRVKLPCESFAGRMRARQLFSFASIHSGGPACDPCMAKQLCVETIARKHKNDHLQTPTVGLEPTTTRLRALRSADWARRA